METTLRLIPMYWVRVIGGLAYLGGVLLLGVNMLMTWRSRPSTYEVPVHEAPALSKTYVEPPEPVAARGQRRPRRQYRLQARTLLLDQRGTGAGSGCR